ncbi:hypothetical protein C8R45DRAFT_1088924 [Mycena sanguinolenta]|nr:hypothetical protein C8R45DRAFT_1088924 [Mycena sanguinolenta]
MGRVLDVAVAFTQIRNVVAAAFVLIDTDTYVANEGGGEALWGHVTATSWLPFFFLPLFRVFYSSLKTPRVVPHFLLKKRAFSRFLLKTVLKAPSSPQSVMDPSAYSSFAADDPRLSLETDTSIGSIDSTISAFLDINNSPASHSQKPAPSPSPDIFGNSEMDLANLDAAFWEGTSLSGDPELIMPTVESISLSQLDSQAQESDVEGSADENAQDWGDSADDEEEEEDQLMSSEPRSGPPPKRPLVDPFLATSTPPRPNLPRLNYNSPLVLYASTDEDEGEQVGGGRMREATPPESPEPTRLRYRLTPTPNAGAVTKAAVIRRAESALMPPPPVPARAIQTPPTVATGNTQTTGKVAKKKNKKNTLVGATVTAPSTSAGATVTAPSTSTGMTVTTLSGAATPPMTKTVPGIPAAPSKKPVHLAGSVTGPASAAAKLAPSTAPTTAPTTAPPSAVGSSAALPPAPPAPLKKPAPSTVPSKKLAPLTAPVTAATSIQPPVSAPPPPARKQATRVALPPVTIVAAKQGAPSIPPPPTAPSTMAAPSAPPPPAGKQATHVLPTPTLPTAEWAAPFVPPLSSASLPSSTAGIMDFHGTFDDFCDEAEFESIPLPPPPQAMQSPPRSPSPPPTPTSSAVNALPDVAPKPSRTGKLTAAQEASLIDCFTRLQDTVNECSRSTGLDTERVLRGFANHLDDKFEHERPNRWNLYQKYANHSSNILVETARIKTEAEMAEIGDDPGSAPLLNAAELSLAYQIFSKEYPGKYGEELLLKHAEYVAVEAAPTHEQRQRRFESDMRKLTGMMKGIQNRDDFHGLVLLVGPHVHQDTDLCDLYTTPALTDFFKNIKYSADDILGIAKTTAYAWDIDRLHDIKGRGEDMGGVGGEEDVEGVGGTATPEVQRARPARRIKSERPAVVKNDYSGMSEAEKKAAQRALAKNRSQTTKSANQALKDRLVKASRDDLGLDIFDQGNGFMWTITPSVLARENVIMIGYPADHVRLPNETPPGKASNGWRIDDREGLDEALDARGTAGEGLRFVRRPYKQGGIVIFSHDYSLLPPSFPTGSPEYQKHWRTSSRKSVPLSDGEGRLWSGIYDLDRTAPVISKLPMSIRWQGKARKRSATALDEDADAGEDDDAESEEIEAVPPPKKKARASTMGTSSAKRTASGTRTSAAVRTAPAYAPSPRVTRSATASKNAEPPQQAGGGNKRRQGGSKAVHFEDDESDDSDDEFFADDSPQPKKRLRTPVADTCDANDNHFTMDSDEGMLEQPVATFQGTLYSAQTAVAIADTYSSGPATVALQTAGSSKAITTKQLQKLVNTTHNDATKPKGRQNVKASSQEPTVVDGAQRPRPRPRKKPEGANAAGASVSSVVSDASDASVGTNVTSARNEALPVPPAAPFIPQPGREARNNVAQPVATRPVVVPHAPPAPPPAHAPSLAQSGPAAAPGQHIPAGTHAFAAQPPATIDPAALIAAMDPAAMANLMTALAPQLLTAMLNQLPGPPRQ